MYIDITTFDFVIFHVTLMVNDHIVIEEKKDYNNF